MRPKAILFDAGGTMVHIDPELLGDLLEPVAGTRPPPELVRESFHRCVAEFSPGLARDWELGWPRRYLELCGIEGQAAVDAFLSVRGLFVAPIPGARDALEVLREAGIRAAAVSNSDGGARYSLERAGLLDLFEFVVDSHEVGVEKPDPAIFRIALDRLGLPAERVWHVGDSYFHDIGGARAAGLAEAVLVDPLGLAPEDQLRVGSVAELPPLILGGPAASSG
ncbi:MAG: HAD family hydrolase [Acidimicrobiia bacterium]